MALGKLDGSFVGKLVLKWFTPWHHFQNKRTKVAQFDIIVPRNFPCSSGIDDLVVTVGF